MTSMEAMRRPDRAASRHRCPVRWWWPLAIATLAVVATACATTPPADESGPDDALESGVWDVESGHKLKADDFVDQLAEARFVIVGESHGTPWHHDVQNRIYTELVDRRHGVVALGLEMVERRFQAHVDAYADGSIDEHEMLSKVQWEQRWGVDAESYAPIWRTARDRDHPIVALNARRELVSAVGESGLDGLDEDTRDELPDIDATDDDYRNHLRRVFGAHHDDGDSEEALDRFFEAQLVWDETMAETAFDFVEHDGADQIVILTGRGHMERGFGIPSGLQRRGASPDDIATVVAVSTTGPRAETMQKYLDLDFLRSHEIADYVWIE